MAIAETLKIEGETPEGAKRIIQEFFDRKWIDPVAAGRRVAEVAAEVRREHAIKGADSLHVATSLVTRCPILLTDDGRDKTKKNSLLSLDKKLSLDGNTLRIMTPEEYHAMRVAEVNPIFAKPEKEGGAMPDGGTDGDGE